VVEGGLYKKFSLQALTTEFNDVSIDVLYTEKVLKSKEKVEGFAYDQN